MIAVVGIPMQQTSKYITFFSLCPIPFIGGCRASQKFRGITANTYLVLEAKRCVDKDEHCRTILPSHLGLLLVLPRQDFPDSKPFFAHPLQASKDRIRMSRFGHDDHANAVVECPQHLL